MSLPSALDVIARRESGGKNILNHKYGPGFSASGYYQMINSTWQRWAKAAGIDVSRWPRAIDAPKEVQDAVAAQGYRMEGFKPWEATKHLVGQEANYSATGSTGAVYPSQKVQPNANGIPGGVRPEDLAWGGGYTPTPQGVVSPGGTAPSPATGPPKTIQEVEAILKAEFPALRVTSGYRSPEYNRSVGGAQGSQHMHGRAIDIGLKELPEETRRAIVDRAVALGVRGIGYYPNSTSIHLDMREGAPAAWGPNKSRTSLNQTPDWFQAAANRVFQGTGSTGAAYPSQPGVPTANANGVPGGIRPSDLPWGGGYTPVPPGVLTPAGTAPAPATSSPSLPAAPAPNSDAARALSDPSRYGVPPEMIAALRSAAAPKAPNQPSATTVANAPSPSAEPSFFEKLFAPQAQPPAPKPPGVVAPTGTAPPPPTNAPATIGTALAQAQLLPPEPPPLDPRLATNQAPVIGEPYDPNKKPLGLLGGW